MSLRRRASWGLAGRGRKASWRRASGTTEAATSRPPLLPREAEQPFSIPGFGGFPPKPGFFPERDLIGGNLLFPLSHLRLNRRYQGLPADQIDPLSDRLFRGSILDERGDYLP